MGLYLHLHHLFYLSFVLFLVTVYLLIILPNSTFLYTCLACSFVKYWLSLGLLQFTCPPMLVLRGKNAVESFLPFISLNVLVFNFLQSFSIEIVICACH